MNYEEKLNLAKEALESGSYDKNTIEYIFPELKESEDEKIRGKLLQWLKLKLSNHKVGFVYEEMKQWIAWLEKQGQKPTWSVYDEEFLRRAIKATKDVYPMTAKWLESLKERMKGE